MIDAGHRRFDTICRCGHERRSHIDAYSLCDECDCRRYDGPHIDIDPPTYSHAGWESG